jgi:hypothetical protein
MTPTENTVIALMLWFDAMALACLLAFVAGVP